MLVAGFAVNKLGFLFVEQILVTWKPSQEPALMP